MLLTRHYFLRVLIFGDAASDQMIERNPIMRLSRGLVSHAEGNGKPLFRETKPPEDYH